MKVLFSVPFFAPAVAKLPVRFDSSVKTAATNGKEIIWNPEWFDTLPDAVLPTVLCHESAHCLFGHLWRKPAHISWDVWNQATDHTDNNMLKQWSAMVTARGLADPFPFPDPPEAYLCNPSFAELPEEKIADMLNGQKTDPGQGQDPNGPGQPGQSGQNGQPGQPGQGKGKQPGQGKPAPHSMPEFGGMVPSPCKQADPDQKKLATEWDRTMGQCTACAKGRGDIPGMITEYVQELFSPTVPWYELLRNWLREQAADDWDFMVPNKYFDESDFILPSLRNEKIGSVVMAKDTSGSICCYPKVCSHFVSEQQAALDDLRPGKLIDICCDTRVTRVKEYTPGDVIDKDLPGGGGTDFRPIFEHVEQMAEQPKCLVILTDLDGMFPAVAPSYPVLWVVYGTDRKAPFGDTIPADESVD